MKRKIFLLAVSLMAISGCSSPEIYKGNGEYYSLSKRYVIYRDLTRPIDTTNVPQRGDSDSIMLDTP